MERWWRDIEFCGNNVLKTYPARRSEGVTLPARLFFCSWATMMQMFDFPVKRFFAGAESAAELLCSLAMRGVNSLAGAPRDDPV